MNKILALVLASLVLLPVLPVYATVLPQGYYLYIPIHVKALSALIYVVSSNATVTVSVMTPSQLAEFNQTGKITGIVTSNSTLVEGVPLVANAVLLNPGDYYLVVYSPENTANLTYFDYNLTPVKPENSSQYVAEFVTVPPDGYLSIPVHYYTLGSPSNLVIFGVSNETVEFQVYNNASQLIFNSSPATLTMNYSSLTCYYNVSLPEGLYYLYIVNPHSAPAEVYFAYRLQPEYVDPYLRSILYNTAALPYGIASYGVTGHKTYVINSTSIRGFFNITSIIAYNGTQDLVPQYGASLQLNSVLVINNNDNTSQILWTQNVVSFITNVSAVNFCVNIWNMTYPSASILNSTVEGNGRLVNSSGQYFYAYGTPYTVYNLPLAGFLAISEHVIPGKGVEVTFSYDIVQNGTYTNSSAVYDTVLIRDPNVSSACFLVDGTQYTPAGPISNFGNYYDAELVFGGFASGEITQFESLDAALALCYFNGTGYEKFPSYYTFGADTAEAAGDVHVVITPQGVAEVTVGKPVLTYSAVKSLSPITIHYPVQSTTQYTSTTSSPKTTQPTTTSSATVVPSSSVPVQNAAPQQSTGTQVSPSTIGALALVVLLVLFVVIVLLRRK